jgi:hypothetical protein
MRVKGFDDSRTGEDVPERATEVSLSGIGAGLK